MHELSLALDLVETAARAAAGSRVRRVVVELGTLAGVLPEALRFAFECAIRDSPLAGAALELVRVQGRIRCGPCGRDYDVDRPLGLCPAGHPGIEELAGREIRLLELEVG